MRVLGIETSCDETAVAVVEAPAGDQPIGRIPFERHPLPIINEITCQIVNEFGLDRQAVVDLD